MYILSVRNDVTRSLKKIKKSCSKKAFNEFKIILDEICKDPVGSGEAYTGNLTGMFKYVHGTKPEYRIIYAFYDMEHIKANPNCFEDLELTEEDFEIEEGIVDVMFIKTREECNNLYKKNLKYFQDKLR